MSTSGVGGGGMPSGYGSDAQGWSTAVNTDVINMGGRDTTNVMKGGGDVEMLKKLLDSMAASSTPEGMQALIDSIFKTGFEKNMPTLLNAANTAGVRPQDATTQQLLTNDLIARLTGEGAAALREQQTATAQAASSYGQLTEKPIVTKISGEGKASGTVNRFELLGKGLFG